ncbi:alcohol dehydrogenase catalytic domain-containing protein [Candidatus Uhrbacteria bacterium]|nr:alcohol dehydrogenase catalytic domain-containing protein [Candidatus Uhrbacteria bacterium]
MRAVGLYKSKPGVAIADIAKPTIARKTEVLVRILSSAIDGSDFSLIKNHLVEPPQDEQFMTLGHESVGVVEAIGADVKNLNVGDFVVPTVRRGCGLCPACQANMSDYCYTGLYKEHGLHFLHGFLTEYTVAQEKYLVRVEKGDLPIAVWVEPASIVVKAFDQMLRIQQRVPSACSHLEHDWDQSDWPGCKRALVLGAGPLGFLAVAWLRSYGIETYVLEVVHRDALKIQMVKEMGARYVDGRNFGPKKIMEGIGHVDVIFEATGASDVALSFIEMMSRNSVYLLMGVPRAAENNICFDANSMLRHIVRQNQVILGSVNSNAEHFRRAVEFVRTVNAKFSGILERAITHRFTLDQYEQAFERGDDRLKVVFDIGTI